MFLLRKFSPYQESLVTAAMKWIQRKASTGELHLEKRRAKGTKVQLPASPGGLCVGCFCIFCMCDVTDCYLQASHGAFCNSYVHKGMPRVKPLLNLLGLLSEVLSFHKGRALGMKSRPESWWLSVNFFQPWKTNAALQKNCETLPLDMLLH